MAYRTVAKNKQSPKQTTLKAATPNVNSDCLIKSLILHSFGLRSISSPEGKSLQMLSYSNKSLAGTSRLQHLQGTSVVWGHESSWRLLWYNVEKSLSRWLQWSMRGMTARSFGHRERCASWSKNKTKYTENTVWYNMNITRHEAIETTFFARYVFAIRAKQAWEQITNNLNVVEMIISVLLRDKMGVI